MADDIKRIVDQVVAEYSACRDARLTHLQMEFQEVVAGDLDLTKDTSPLAVSYIDPVTEAAFKWFVLGYAKGSLSDD